VHVAALAHLAHRGVPVRVVGGRGCKLGFVIGVGPRVAAVPLEGVARPRGNAGVAVVVRLILDEVHRQFAANDQLLQIRRAVRVGGRGLRHRARHVHHRNVPEMKIRGEERHLLRCRLAARLRVALERSANERAQPPQRFGRPSAEAGHGTHTVVDVELGEQRRNVGEIEGWRQVETGGRLGNRAPAQPLQILVAVPQQLRTYGARCRLALVRHQSNGNDHVALHLHHPAPGALRNAEPPELLMTQIAAVAHDQRGAAGQLEGGVIRGGTAHDEGDTAVAQGRMRLLQTLEHERVVPRIRLGIAVGKAEADDHRQAQTVCTVHGVLEGGIRCGALRLLHPVENVAPRPPGRIVEVAQAGWLDAQSG